MFVRNLRRGLGNSISKGRSVRDRFVQAIDPTPWLASRVCNQSEAPRAAMICVYRSRNAALVESLVQQALSLNMKVALWALDRAVQSLSSLTIGSGPGLRLMLLNRLCETVRRREIDHVVVSDDDVSFTRGSLAQLLSTIRDCGFGLAQPAITFGWNHEFTRVRFLTLARWTSFVEIGPMFVVDKLWFPSILPFPEEYGMGWGLDLAWQELIPKGCRLGIVDSVCLSHLILPREYDEDEARIPLKHILKARNIRRLSNVQHCYASWRPWQTQPPWFASPIPLKTREDLITRSENDER